MANTSAGLGAFASGMANGLSMGMKYQDMQNSAELAKAATEKQQADKAANAGTAIQSAAAQPGSFGIPGQKSTQDAFGLPGYKPTQSQVMPGAQPEASGGQPWSFIGSMFGGSNG